MTESEPSFIGRETLDELFWVLRRAYGFQVAQICDVIDELSMRIASARGGGVRGGPPKITGRHPPQLTETSR